ncbi:MAG: acylphosphatase [Lachnospiraceae bacterium]|nr:acylphosphatase [Lachnospiraceae bacterium]
MTEKIRKRLIFHGRVQGVGFRYRATGLALSIGLTGWVQNESDGTVSMEVQGSGEQIDKLLITLNKSDFIRIDHLDSAKIAVKSDEKKFRIQY